jgi:hypothetical protein
MAVAKKIAEEEIDPEHPQYQHGMEAGVSALASLPRVPQAAAPVESSAISAGAGALPGLQRRTITDPINTGGGIGGLPRTAGPSPAVGGTQAILPPKIEPPKSLPRKRNQSAIEQPNPADFFRR